jgi:hypothetical protein
VRPMQFDFAVLSSVALARRLAIRERKRIGQALGLTPMHCIAPATCGNSLSCRRQATNSVGKPGSVDRASGHVPPRRPRRSIANIGMRITARTSFRHMPGRADIGASVIVDSAQHSMHQLIERGVVR